MTPLPPPGSTLPALLFALAPPPSGLPDAQRRQAPQTAKGFRRGPLPWAHAPTQRLFPAVVAVAAVPVLLGAAGFTGAGIAASSLAAKMMSAAAVANGGGVAAGSLVAMLQSVGLLGDRRREERGRRGGGEQSQEGIQPRD